MSIHRLPGAALALGLVVLAVAAPARAGFSNIHFDPGFQVNGGNGFAADGTAYLVTHTDDYETRLRRIATDGTQRWDMDIGGFSATASAVRVRNNRACVAVLQGPQFAFEDLRVSVLCFDATSGALVWRANDLATGLPYQRPVVGIAADNSVSLLYVADGGPAHRVAIAADGTPGANVSIANTNFYLDDASFADNGSTLVALGTQTNTEYVLVSASGAVVRRFDAADFGLVYFTPTQAADGSVLLVGVQQQATSQRTIAIKLGPDGTQAWRVTLRMVEDVPLRATIANGAAYVSLARDTSPGDDTVAVGAPFSDLALDYATGTARWDTTLIPLSQGFFHTTVAPSGTTLVNTLTDVNKLRVQVVDAASGGYIRESEYDCQRFSCSDVATHIDDTGTVRLIIRHDADNTVGVYTLEDALRPPVPLLMNQLGLRGAWNVGTNGQGIVVDFEPVSGTLFAPWFTMKAVPRAQEEDNTVVDLRWYTMQATVGASAREALVTLYETAGGSFATGAPIAPRRVGVGILRFSSCDEGSLEYQFDPGENLGVQGIVGMTRLTPRTNDCVTDAGMLPATAAAQDANGFRSVYSGSWSQVGSGGQGLELVVLPGANISGAWFTFDPAGAANDTPRQHHWFTLFGDLSTAANATVTATLYRTVGGTFDFRPSASITSVGTATIRFQSCGAATLDYAFGPNADHFSNLSGSIALEHLGNCIGQ